LFYYIYIKLQNEDIINLYLCRHFLKCIYSDRFKHFYYVELIINYIFNIINLLIFIEHNLFLKMYSKIFFLFLVTIYIDINIISIDIP